MIRMTLSPKADVTEDFKNIRELWEGQRNRMCCMS